MNSGFNVRMIAENFAHHCPVGNVGFIKNTIFRKFSAASNQGVQQNGCMPAIKQR